MPGDPASRAETIEREIAERIAAAGLRLRFDKVALRLIAGLQAGLAQIVPEDQSIIFTVTAPIKHPAKTTTALQSILLELPAGKLRRTVNGNQMRARRVTPVSTDMPRVIGFVHNPESDADLILDVTEAHLREQHSVDW